MSEFEKLKIVTKYELLKQFRRRRLYAVVAVVIAVVVSILAGLPLLGKGYHEFGPGVDDVTAMAGMLSISATIAAIGVVFFAGDAIAGEFEKKTGYILFPNPVRRTTMVIGKYLACYAAIALIILLVYGIVCTSLLGIYGQIPIEVGGSLALSLLFAGSVLSLTFFFSSISKGAMGATVMTLAFVLIIIATIDGVLWMAGQPSWFLLSRAGDATVMVYPGFKAMMAEMAGTYGIQVGAIEYNMGLRTAAMTAYLAVCLLPSIWIAKRREMLKFTRGAI